MPYRKVPLATGEYYHVFNRGVARTPIYINARDYTRFIQVLSYYRYAGIQQKFSAGATISIGEDNPRLVDIIAYCLMPNHFHLLIKQKVENGIVHFISNLCNSYSKYFNTKNKRVGTLFQGPFKAVHIETEEQLLHVNRYIHINPLVSFIVKDINAYRWSSFSEYLGDGESNLCEKDIIMHNFSTSDLYKKFVLDQVDYAKKLSEIKHLLIDVED